MTPKRKFTLTDLLLLIAAIAVGLAWTRHYQHTEQGSESYPYEDDGFGVSGIGFIPAYRVRVIIWWIIAFYHVVSVVTMCVLVLRLRKPRPRRLTRQPGTVACAAATFAILTELIGKIPSAIQSVTWGGHDWRDFGDLAYWDMDGPLESMAVAVAWLLMALSRRWRRERDWIDNFGIILGAFWLITPPLIWFANSLMGLQ